MGARTLILALVLFGVTGGARAQSVADGELYFQRNCSGCHSVDPTGKSGAGPSLFGVVGRPAGSAMFNYSAALKGANAKGFKWTAASLDTFLSDPQKTFPGTLMPARITGQADRSNVIAYLATRKARLALKPVPPSTKVKPKPAPPEAPAVDAPMPLASIHGSWADDAPGKVHTVIFANLPAAANKQGAGNGAKIVPQPNGAIPAVPAGFKISLMATDPDHGRLMLVAPNGDIFISAPGTGEIKVLHPAVDGTGEFKVFADGLSQPYGMAFYPSGSDPKYLYVANINSIVRIAYNRGDQKARAVPETVVASLSIISGNHTTRSLVFSRDDKRMFLSIGSATNVADTMPAKPPVALAEWEARKGLGAAWGDEEGRAMVISFDPNGGDRRTYATGLRNCVGLAVYPTTGDVICSVNERDNLGDDVPPDYVTRVAQGAFYGWPWYYLGDHEDPRLANARPDLKDKVTTPDLLLQAHSAPLGITVYQAASGAKAAFPADYRGDIFLALHGSWNRSKRTNSKVVRIMMKDGKPTGSYEDFVTGFVLDDASVWGRPSSVAVAADGALIVDDDASGTFWRITPVN